METDIIDDVEKIFSDEKSLDFFSVKEETKTIKANNEDFQYELSYKRKDIEDEKEMFKFIKNVEKIIRGCPEYRDWVNYVRDVIGLNECQITGEIHSEAKSDIHHHPISLYSFCKSYTKKYIEDGIEFTSLDIANVVMEKHFELKVGFVSLLKSIHEKYHNGCVKIPMKLVQGDYKFFIDNMLKYLDEDEQNSILDKITINEKNCGWSSGYKWIIEENTNKEDIDKCQ